MGELGFFILGFMLSKYHFMLSLVFGKSFVFKISGWSLVIVAFIFDVSFGIYHFIVLLLVLVGLPYA